MSKGGVMLDYYHLHSRKKHLESICEQGLLPTIGENLIMTGGVPAVHLKIPPGKSCRWTLHFHADAILLEVEPKKKKLFHWRTWASENGVVLARLDKNIEDEFGKWVAEDNRFHYVHFGIIPASRIMSWAPVDWRGVGEDGQDSQAAQASMLEHQKELQQQLAWGRHELDAQILQQCLDMGEGSSIEEECEILLRSLKLFSSAEMMVPLHALQRVRDGFEDARTAKTPKRIAQFALNAANARHGRAA